MKELEIRTEKLLKRTALLNNLLGDDASVTAFQNFLVAQRRSSHAWVIGQRK